MYNDEDDNTNLIDQELFLKSLTALMQRFGYELEDLLTINVIISAKNDKPAVFLRRNTTEKTYIKRLIKAAYHNQPLIIMPQFTNSLNSISTAIKHGILYKDGSQYRFTF